MPFFVTLKMSVISSRVKVRMPVLFKGYVIGVNSLALALSLTPSTKRASLPLPQSHDYFPGMSKLGRNMVMAGI